MLVKSAGRVVKQENKTSQKSVEVILGRLCQTHPDEDDELDEADPADIVDVAEK